MTNGPDALRSSGGPAAGLHACRVAVFALLLTSLAQARPNVIDEWVRLPVPTDLNLPLFGSFGVAIDGDWALVSAFDPCPTCEEGRTYGAALLYRFTGGTSWQYQGILGTRQQMELYRRPGLAMKNGIAVVTLEIEKDYENLIRSDATALLRPKTALKDMFLEVNPGTVAAAAGRFGSTFRAACSIS